MTSFDHQQAVQLEQELTQQIEQTYHNAALFEQAALAELGRLHEAAACAAEAGMDLQTYAAVLAQEEMHEIELHELASRLELVLGSHELGALAIAEAGAADMDLESYLAALSPEEWDVYDALLEAEAAQAAAEDEDLELAMAHEEAAAAGMDLETYAHLLSGAADETSADEQAMLEITAYHQGIALRQAELAAALQGGLSAEDIAYLELIELQRQQTQAWMTG